MRLGAVLLGVVWVAGCIDFQSGLSCQKDSDCAGNGYTCSNGKCVPPGTSTNHPSASCVQSQSPCNTTEQSNGGCCPGLICGGLQFNFTTQEGTCCLAGGQTCASSGDCCGGVCANGSCG